MKASDQQHKKSMVCHLKTAVSALLAMATAGCAAQSARDSSVQDAGSYELLICKRACSFSNRDAVIATAHVVLLEHVMSPKEAQQFNPLFNANSSGSNACYTVERTDAAKTYAGISKAGISQWVINGRTMQFSLFRSPDAGYAVELERTGSSLAGTGRSWGVGMGAPPKDYGPDIIVGRRLGAPNIALCKTRA